MLREEPGEQLVRVEPGELGFGQRGGQDTDLFPEGIALVELIPVRASLEEAFMELTRDSVEYQAAGATR